MIEESSKNRAGHGYNRSPVSEKTLYFAYASMLDPDRISAVAPGAKFLFTAHYPETKLGFVESSDVVALPTLVREPGNTVWGGGKSPGV
jgi:hypothetical protein